MSHLQYNTKKPIKIAHKSGLEVYILNAPLAFYGITENRGNTLVIQMDQGKFKGIEVVAFESLDELTPLELDRFINLIHDNLSDMIKIWIDVNVYGHHNIAVIS